MPKHKRVQREHIEDLSSATIRDEHTENNGNKQIILYYIYWALVGTWFAGGIAVFFNRKYLNLGYLGIVDALVFAIGLVAEIPTGALADRFGRRKIVMLGVTLGGVGFTLWGLSLNGWMILIGNALYALGTSLQSGADDAMMYDFLKENGKEDLWPKVTVNNTIIARASFILSIFLGGIAYSYSDRLPFLLRGLTFFLMVIPLFKLAIVDKFQYMHRSEEVAGEYWAHLKTGVRALFTSKIRWVVPIYLLVQGISYTVFTAGLLRPLLYEHAGLEIKYISAAISVALALTVLLLLIVRKYESKLSTPKPIFLLSFVCAISFSVNLGNSIVLSLIGLTLIQMAAYIIMPMLSVQVNKNIHSKHRATALSTANFMQNAFYVVAAPVVGFMAGDGMINQIVIGAVVVIIIGLALSVMVYEASTKHSLWS